MLARVAAAARVTASGQLLAPRANLLRPFAFTAARGFATDGAKPGDTNASEDPAAQETQKQQEQQPDEEAAPKTVEELTAHVQELTAKCSELEASAAEASDLRLRAYAEMENVRARTQKDIETRTTFANQKFAKSLLDVADNLSRALDSVPEAERAGEGVNAHLVSLYEGVSMTETELSKVLAANGVVPFCEVGDAFDPHRHEAMFKMPHPELANNTVGQVLKRGYMFKDRVLRPAQVGTVAK